MLQRSFRLSEDDLSHLARIADYLARLDKRPANQTRALAWAIARGIEAVEKADSEAREVPESLLPQIGQAADLLRRLSDQWLMTVRHATAHHAGVRLAKVDLAAENDVLAKRNRELEAEVERLRAKPFRG